MKLEELKGYNYVDFKLADQPKNFQPIMEKSDLCKRIMKAINDESQAVVEYKGLILHYGNTLSNEVMKEITEISNDETDHRSKFEVILKDLKC